MAETIKDGIKLYQNGSYTAALTHFLSLPTPDINSPDQKAKAFELIYYIGLTYARLQRHNEAIVYLEQVVTGDANEKRVNQCRFLLALMYSFTGRTRLADAELQQLLDEGYQKAEVYAALAFIEWENKNTAGTIRHYEKALEINPHCPTALNGLGYVLACLGKDLTRALSLCKRAVDIIPDSAAFLDSLGWVYYKLGLLPEARTYIGRALDKNSAHKEIAAHYKTVHLGGLAAKNPQGASI